jgi:outer membrane cobalamin receptor
VRLNVFQRKVSDLIRWADADGDAVLSAGNVARARITGWEAEALYRPSATIEIPVSYQSLSAEDEGTGERLAGSVQSLWRAGVRSAARSFTWSVDYSVTDRGRFRLGDGSWRYAVLNAAVRGAPVQSAAVRSARGRSLRDEDYQTVEAIPCRAVAVREIRIEL